MDFKDSFRERMIALDEIGFIGRPNAKESKKYEYSELLTWHKLRCRRFVN